MEEFCAWFSGEASPFTGATSMFRGSSSSPPAHHGKAALCAGSNASSKSVLDFVEPSDPLRVLVIDGDETSQTGLAEMLHEIGLSSADYGLSQKLEVACASSGEIGWDRLRQSRFDVVLVELDLPGITGLDVAWCYQQSLNDRPQNGGEGYTGSFASGPAAMVAVSASDGLEMQVLYEHGMQDLLRKPVTMASLRHALHKWLPRRCRPLPLLESTASLSRVGPSGVLRSRVLYVEPCRVTATATTCLFQELGMWIDVVADGEEAMSVLSGGRRFDLVLLEVNLPGELSGYALCSWFKELCRRQRQPPALFVALTSEPDLETCRAFDIDRCLPKPLTAGCVTRVVYEWIAHAQAVVGASASGRGAGALDAAATSATGETAGLGVHDGVPHQLPTSCPPDRIVFDRTPDGCA